MQLAKVVIASALVLATCAEGLHAWRCIFINCNIWYHLWFESVISPCCLLVPSVVQLEFCTGHRELLIQDAREAVTMIPAKLAVHWHVLCIQWRIYCLDNYTCHSTWNCCHGYVNQYTRVCPLWQPAVGKHKAIFGVQQQSYLLQGLGSLFRRLISATHSKRASFDNFLISTGPCAGNT